MKNQHETIKKITTQFINKEENGGFWLPNIQRHFVWNESQIEKLFDSIMRKYPIGTLLVWKTKSNIPTRQFISHYESRQRLRTEPGNENSKLLVLDGQQRLQSLFLGIKGSYNRKTLFFNILSGDKTHPEEISYEFKFMNEEKAKLPWIKFKNLVLTDMDAYDLEQEILDRFKSNNFELDKDNQKRIKKNIARVNEVFKDKELILYQELDSIDAPQLYADDDVVEIFIRANSGGTVLGKSDLLFSLLTVEWPEAEEKINELLNDLNLTGYEFTRDFILKTCLSLLGKGATYNVRKFRDDETRNKIIESWNKINNAICDVKDFVFNKTFVRSNKSMSSYLILIPLIYFRYHYPDKWEQKEGNQTINYILRTLLGGAFSGTPDTLIDRCTKNIDEHKDLVVADIFRLIREDNRGLGTTKEAILDQYYGSKNIHLIFSLWYKDFDYHPTFQGNEPQIDHIFPQSELKRIKIINPETGRPKLKYPWEFRDQIANLALLTSKENGFTGKSGIPAEEWFKDKPEKYLDIHLIPKDKELWKTENFEKFIEERKKLILKKFENLLVREE